ncbi:MAG: response regulator [Candidatus Sericytochromatia bacterium]|nr:response regulator [Candidatus Sericytochromatia bacterium]
MPSKSGHGADRATLVLLDALPDGHCIMTADGTVCAWSHRMAEWTGIPAEMACGGTIETLLPGWRRSGLDRTSALVCQGAGPVIVDGRVAPLLDGATVIRTVRLAILPGEPGEAPRLLVTLSVVDPPRAQTVASADMSWQQIAAQVPGAVYHLVTGPDRSATVPFISSGIEAIYGISAETAQADALQLLTPILAEDLGPVRQSFLAAATAVTAWYCEFRIRRPDGTVRWLQNQAAPQSQVDGRIAWHGLISDATERRQAGEELSRSRILLTAVIENAGQSIFSVDRLKQVTVANSQFRTGYLRTYGVPVIIGKHLGHGLDSNLFQQWEGWFSRAFAGESFRVDFSVTNAAGLKYFEIGFFPIDVDGTIEGVNCFSYDVTERKHTEAELLRQKELAEASTRAKSEFLATISHEIRTPLNGVLGMADLLMDDPLSDEQAEYLAAMRRSAEALSVLLNNLLDLSRIDAGRLFIDAEPFELAGIFAAVTDLLATQACQKQIDLIIDLPDTLPARLVGDASRLKQILLNLTGNAVKFTQHGHVRLTVAGAALPEGRLALTVCVEDTGIGIPEDKQAALFGKFVQADASTTRRYGGSGLGLAICRELVALMDGSISLTSVAGQGSVFTMTVPLGVADPQRPSPAGHGPSVHDRGPTASVTVDRAGCRLLVVGDNDNNLRAASRMLERLGCTVDRATDGRSAVAMAAAHPYDLIFMDCQMPDMDGYQATTAIRRLPGAVGLTPIVALTAYAMNGDRERCLAAGMSDYLCKPVTREALRITLDRWVLSRPGR